MKAVGIVRRIDNLGRVIIPREIRNSLLIDEGDPLEIFIEDNGIVMKKYVLDYDFNLMITDLERRFNLATEIVGHKNSKEIQKRFTEIKSLWNDTNLEK